MLRLTFIEGAPWISAEWRPPCSRTLSLATSLCSETPVCSTPVEVGYERPKARSERAEDMIAVLPGKKVNGEEVDVDLVNARPALHAAEEAFKASGFSSRTAEASGATHMMRRRRACARWRSTTP